ncbi:adenosylcobinamide-GDP ribazoletransferase [Roseibium sp. CAU 1637]|uniref:Adenosylcobinamide-GDP ribazoletransferase n=1 Tax=Roseibium limicola TaxID=2816037 RepID=A0A939J6F3_9HYPH|nr:adenosylcobinamide-GDP ribazoletransferase [Roseibium limicola]MBO0345067.1 adenosylcobinamide-GDP ribazoletransferase [Roseibium limicola]
MDDGENRSWAKSLKQVLRKWHPLQVASDVAACVRFFSRLPLPPAGPLDRIDAAPDFSRISYAAPLAGLVISAPAALLTLVLGLTPLPDLVVATLAVALLVAVCGALHEDGLGDVVDGFFGGTTPKRRMEIMKDSRVGAFGALTLAIAILLRVLLLAGLLQALDGWAVVPLVVGEALSRGLMIWQWRSHPSARPGGLGARFGKPDAVQVNAAALICGLALLTCLISVPLLNLALGGLLASAGAYGVGRLAVSKIGGTTGDVLGAAQQIAVICFLIGLQLAPM